MANVSLAFGAIGVLMSSGLVERVGGLGRVEAVGGVCVGSRLDRRGRVVVGRVQARRGRGGRVDGSGRGQIFGLCFLN